MQLDVFWELRLSVFHLFVDYVCKKEYNQVCMHTVKFFCWSKFILMSSAQYLVPCWDQISSLQAWTLSTKPNRFGKINYYKLSSLIEIKQYWNKILDGKKTLQSLPLTEIHLRFKYKKTGEFFFHIKWWFVSGHYGIDSCVKCAPL